MTFRHLLLTAACALGSAALPALAGTIGYAYNAEGQLFSFDLLRPSSVTSIGDPVGPAVKAIDVRPGTTTLYAVDVTASLVRLFSVDPATGVRTPVGTGFPLSGTMPANYNLAATDSFGLDFNPTTLQMDGSVRIRFVSSDGDNLRLHSDTGAIAAVDGTLAYTSGMPAASAIAAAAYTNSDTSRAGATPPPTALYYLDTANDNLVLSGNPNGGTFDVVGMGLGIDIDAVAGFDIITANGLNKAYAAVKLASASVYTLHTVNLETGVAGPAIGTFPLGFEPVGGFTISTVANPALPKGTEGYSYTSGGQLIAFALEGGGTLATRTIGAPVGTSVKGLDFLPGTTKLHTIDVNSTMAQVFTVHPETGVRTAVGNGFANTGTAPAPYTISPTSSFGFDFNPTTLQMDGSARIRLVDSSNNSLRLNSATGGVAAVDAMLGYSGGLPAIATIVAAAYTNSDSVRAGSTAPGTQLFYIDAANDNLVTLETNPNGGQFTPVGPLGIDVSVVAGFDIFVIKGRNVGYALLEDTSGTVNLYLVDLVTGSAGMPLGGFAAASVPVGGLAIATNPDVTRPRVTILRPRSQRQRVSRPQFLVRGVASDIRGIKRVEYRVGPGVFRVATGTTNWRFNARVRPGANRVLVRAYDVNGNVSAVDSAVLVRKSARIARPVVPSVRMTQGTVVRRPRP